VAAALWRTVSDAYRRVISGIRQPQDKPNSLTEQFSAGALPIGTSRFTSTDVLLFYNPPETMALTIGTQLGSHEITGLLGNGGMGDVHRARDLKLKR